MKIGARVRSSVRTYVTTGRLCVRARYFASDSPTCPGDRAGHDPTDRSRADDRQDPECRHDPAAVVPIPQQPVEGGRNRKRDDESDDRASARVAEAFETP